MSAYAIIHFLLFLKSASAFLTACIDAYESGVNAPASIYIPFILSLSLAFFIADIVWSRPIFLSELPVSWSMNDVSALSAMLPDRFITNTELSFRLLVCSLDAIIPTSDIIPKNIITTENSSIPSIVAPTYLKKSFIV